MANPAAAIAKANSPRPPEYQRLLEAVSQQPTWALYQALRPYNCSCADFRFVGETRPDGEIDHYPLCNIGKWQILGDKLKALGLDRLDSRSTSRAVKAMRRDAKLDRAVKSARKSAPARGAKTARRSGASGRPAKTASGKRARPAARRSGR